MLKQFKLANVLGESTREKIEYLTYKVKREMGSNGNQTITWRVHPINNSDVEPSFGKLQFGHNQTEVYM